MRGEPIVESKGQWVMPLEGANITLYGWLVLIAFVVALTTRRIPAPYAVTLVVTGLIIGIPRLLPQAQLDPRVLFSIFLPPLLFESAIHLRTQAILRDSKPIAALALVGTR